MHCAECVLIGGGKVEIRFLRVAHHNSLGAIIIRMRGREYESAFVQHRTASLNVEEYPILEHFSHCSEMHLIICPKRLYEMKHTSRLNVYNTEKGMHCAEWCAVY